MSQTGTGTDSQRPADVPAPRTPGALRCEMWFADIASVRPAHLALLNDVEQRRRERYLKEADRARFTAGVALTRLVVAQQTGTVPDRVRVDRTCPRCSEPHGKPRIVDADVHMSLSHSGDKVAFALTREAAVGVDVEVVGDRDVTGLAEAVLVAAEPVRRAEEFYTYWCRKESVVKATGEGLRVPLREVVVSPADTPAQLISYRGAALACSLADLSVGPGYAAAVTVLAEGSLSVRIHDASAVLA
ncbi:4'-phosphopantetheinyl transferase family protein [Rugosimonospora africana]|uniref:4'-phosphopantetheinyl transferase n=1 Tax=Rugosimonospora africana TaxID=556532 RepID=A0A8J3QNX1_9ACTN|nr:4'-phosphopantetheinyl transferase superfamily protein [Rugosimonospora africana]GIH14418.1 4'-phosphopantetheinyl transferase [Rugosimonospora africana]